MNIVLLREAVLFSDPHIQFVLFYFSFVLQTIYNLLT